MPGSPNTARLITPTMLGAWLVLATVPLWISSVGLYPYIGVEIIIWSIYALAFNLVLGTSGLPSFGHGAFFGVGAYAYGLAQFNVATSLWICLASAAASGMLAGLFVGLFISHRRGVYFALLTIAFGQIFWTIALKAYAITGGEDGLLDIARLPADFGVISFSLDDNTDLYYFVLAVFAVVVVLLWRLVNSPYGRILSAIRQSEVRTAHLGYNVWFYKLSIIVASAAFSGFAGGLFAMAQRSAFPDVMNFAQSGLVVMMTLVGGGLVSFWGPVVGVIVFLIARDVIGAMTNAWMLYFGTMFVLLVLFRPEGIAGGVKDAHGTLEGARYNARFSELAVWERMMALLEVEGVHVRFGHRVVLEEINLSVTEGELHGIMGPNGAGKTTFFNTLTGSVKPSRGRIRLNGEDVAGLAPHAIARKGVARSFQIMTLFNEFTAQENVTVALPTFRARGFDVRRSVAGDGALADEAHAVLASVGLTQKSGVSAKLLSYGDRRALEIAVALAQRPRVLCLDEPTSGLGSDGTLRLAELIGGLKGKVTIVTVEHDMRFLFSLADQISVLHWGQVIARGTPRELQENPWVRRSNLGSFG